MSFAASPITPKNHIYTIDHLNDRVDRSCKKKKALMDLVNEEFERHVNVVQQFVDDYGQLEDDASSPYVNALVDRITESETCIRNLQVNMAVANTIDMETYQIQRDMLKEMRNICKEMLESETPLAIRQICTALKQKLFVEIAGDRKDSWETLAIYNLNELDSMTNLANTGVNQDDLNYFSTRWQSLKKELNITHNSRQLEAFCQHSKDPGNVRAHDKYKFTADQLKNEAKNVFQSPADRNFLVLLDLNQKLSSKRNESIYKCTSDVASVV